MKILRFLPLFALVVSFFPLLINAEKAEDQVNIEIILDASGSMWEKIDGEYKMDIAKDTLKRIIPKINKDFHLGLRVYGHRTRSCKDSELVSPIAKGNRSKILSKIDPIKALAMTPISYSLEKGAADLKKLNGSKGMLLISDGKETCGADPCQTARDLIKKGMKLKINVVGFDIKDAESKKQLACIAKATGGTYATANNADDLFKKIKKSTETLATKPWNLDVETPSDLEHHYTVTDEKTGKIIIKDKLAFTHSLLKPGTYTVKVDMNPPFTKKGVKIEKGKQVVVKVTGFGEIKVDTIHDLAFFPVFTNQETKEVFTGKEYTLKQYNIPEGKYTVQVKKSSSGKIFWTKKDVEIKTKKVTRLKMIGYGRLKVNTGSMGLVCKVEFLEQKNKKDTWSGYTMDSYILPVGRYIATIKNTNNNKEYELKNLEVTDWGENSIPFNCKK